MRGWSQKVIDLCRHWRRVGNFRVLGQLIFGYRNPAMGGLVSGLTSSGEGGFE